MTVTSSRLGLLAALALTAGCAADVAGAAAPQHHVVLVVVDGLRPDAIAAAAAPNLQRLAAGGATSLKARAVGIPETLASFVTMATGVAPARHGVTWNDDHATELGRPTIYTRVAEAGGTAALYFGKSKLTLLAAPGTATLQHGPGPRNSNWDAGDGPVLARAFAAEFARQAPAFALVHLREPDFIGHDKGWMSPAYLEAVRHDDAALGVVLDAIAASPAAKTTTVMLTADHGGEGTYHGVKGGDASWTIPWLCWGNGIKARTLPGTPTLLDIAPTVLALLGLPQLPGAEGHIVKECVPAAR